MALLVSSRPFHRRPEWRLFCLSIVLASAPGASEAQTDFRLVGTYESVRLGDARFENAYQEILARRTYLLSEVSSFTVTGRLRRDEDLLDRSHLFTGRFDGELRTPAWDLYLRHRPSQRPGLVQPAEWRRRETVFGATFHADRLPQVLYEEARRRRTEGDAQTTRRSRSVDRRLTATWTLFDANLDLTHRRIENGVDSGQDQPVKARRNARDTGGGLEWSRTVHERLQVSGAYRTLFSRWETTRSLRRRSEYQRAESNAGWSPWRALTLSAGGGWQATRQRENGNEWRRDRLLDLTSSLALRPASYLTATFVRSYQEQKYPGIPSNRLDYARAQVTAIGRVLPELEASASAARNWTLSQRGLSAPSNQGSIGLRGSFRRSVSMSYTLSGQVIEGVPRSIRDQVSQNADLRLEPSARSRLALGVQTFRLGPSLTLRRPDRVHYRIDGLLSGSGGASVSATYASQTLRSATALEKYSLSGQVSLPWKRLLLSGTGTAGRAGDAVARRGRDWGTRASASAQTRIYRRSDLTITYTRSLPAEGPGSSIWHAVLTQRLR